MMYPLVQDCAADRIPVVVTCRVLGFSPQGFYAWKKSGVSNRDVVNAYLVNAMRAIHVEEPNYGSDRMWDELVQIHGLAVGHNRVQRLMSGHGIVAATVRGKPKTARPGPPVHDDLVKKNFTASRPNQKWLTDITEHPTSEGKLYVCAVKDIFGNKIVGWSIQPHMRKELACQALQAAINNRDHSGVIIHSDRGSQLRSRTFVDLIAANGLKGSMGRVGAAGDNAAMESFFSRLQVEVLDKQTWPTRAGLQAEIFKWIEVKYNRKRRQKRLGRLSPTDYEKLALTIATA